MSESKKKDEILVFESVHFDEEEDLPTVRGKVPYKVWVVQGLYFLERAGYYGLSQPLRASPCPYPQCLLSC